MEKSGLDKKIITSKNKELSFSGSNQKNGFVRYFTDRYIRKELGGKISLAEEERYSLLKERLKDSTLVDLGCGGPASVGVAFEFATAFDVKEYIGVDMYPFGTEKGYIEFLDYIIAHPESFEADTLTELRNKNHAVPRYSLALGVDMLTFLEQRTTLANFMINGIDENILDLDDGDNEECFKRLQKRISELVPRGGLVFGGNSMYLGALADLGFKQYVGLEDRSSQNQFWEKM